jgi:Flp pilus assembly protein TadD/uncharacterized coiled-coil DUF342 family protein
MRRLLVSLSLGVLALAAPGVVFSQASDFSDNASSQESGDTSDLFLNAYMANEAGEKLEAAGNAQGAIAKYRYAATLLDQISRADPNWNPIVVDYRKKRVSGNIERLEKQVGSQTAPEETAPSQNTAPPENELPQKEESSPFPPPSEIPPQPPTSSQSPAPLPNGVPQDVRDQIQELQSDLRDSRDQLRNVEGQKAALAEHLNDALKQLDQTKVDVATMQAQLKQAQDAYQNSVSDHSQSPAVQKQYQKRIEELENTLKDAEADREAADEQTSDDARRATLAKTAAEAVAKQRDDAVAQQKTLQTELGDKAGTAAKLDAATKENKEVTAQRDAAQAQVQDLQAKLGSASKLATQLTAANKQIASLTKDRDAAAQRADDLDKELADSSKTAAKLVDAQKEIADLKTANQASSQKNDEIGGKLADAKKQIEQITADRDVARKQADDLNGKLSDAQSQIASVKAERDKIAAQRDQAVAELGKTRDQVKKVEQLLAENTSLTLKLAADEKTINDFKSSSPDKDKVIADLRKEVGDAKAQLAAVQQDRDNIQTSLNDLQQQYDSATAQLTELKASSGVGSAEKKTLTDENDLLRGIVMREMKGQAARDQAKRLVMSELSQLGVQSDTLMKRIDYLGEPVVHLSDKEKALFKDPSLDIPDTDDSSMDISIAAPKQPTNAANADLPQVSKADPAPATTPAPVDPAPSPAAVATPAPKSAAIDPMTAPPASPNPKATPGDLAALSNPPGLGDTQLPAAPTLPVTAEGDSTPPQDMTPAHVVPDGLLNDAKDAKDSFDKGQYRDAERDYEKMLIKAPNNVYILSNLGVVYFRNQKSQLAEETLKKAIAVAPEDTFSWRTLGIVYYQEKRFDDAINALTRALAIDPKDAVAHNYLGITASQKGWQEAALKELETSTQYNPNYGDAYFNLAVVYAMQNPPNKDMARKYYKRATDLGAEPDAALEQLLK